MEQRRLTKKEIVDFIIAAATNKLFTGDGRDGAAPPITFHNFLNEMMRHGAKALRARLSVLSFADLLSESLATLKQIEARQKTLQEHMELAERLERESAVRAHRQRQTELGRRSRKQSAILAAARHYRGLNKNAKQAWHAIKRNPYAARKDETVVIEGDTMRVEADGALRKRRGIKFAQWQKIYWPAVK